MGVCGEGRWDGPSHFMADVRIHTCAGEGQWPVAVEMEECRAAVPGGVWAEPQIEASVS